MILVLSQDKYEQGADPVINWLSYYGVKFLKVNRALFSEPNDRWRFDYENRDVYVDGISLAQQVKVIFYRRFFSPFSISQQALNHNERDLQVELGKELGHLTDYFFYILKDKFWFPVYDSVKYTSNKLIVLDIARQHGFSTPQSFLIHTRKEASQVYNQLNRQAIVKPIRHCQYYKDQGRVFRAYTHSLDTDLIERLPETFFPSLVQEKINAVRELRVFYLDGTCFTEAIHSSVANDKISDVKLLSKKKSTHYIPYQLPKKIEENIAKVMNALCLNTGSIDLMQDKDGQYHFLEVNPVGQYLAPSWRCNFQIDKGIAQYLIAKNTAL